MAGIDITTIQNAIPNNLKKQGIDKLSGLLISKGEEIRQQVIPKITDEINKAQTTSDYCNNIQVLLATRNNIVSKLNNIAFTGLSAFFELTILAKSVIDNARLAANIGISVLPVAPGSATSVIDSLGVASNKITFNDIGESKLVTLRNTLGGSAISLAIISASIRTAILLLNSLDALLSKCSNVGNLTPVSTSLITITEQVEKSSQTNDNLYKGFLI